MGKIICEKCGTEFKFEIAKNFECCPVCGASFSDDGNGDLDNELIVQDDGLMYFDEIVEYKDNPEYSHVSVYCGECKEFNDLEPDKFDKLMDKEYAILKKDVVLICRGCGKEHKPRKILYKRKDHYAPPLPRCPVCNSAMLKKITTGSKFLAAATVGMFALPYNSKTFECKDCGYRF